MFCPNCGKEIEENAKFCGSCGAAIEGESVPSTQTQSALNPTDKTGILQKKRPGKKIVAAVGVIGVLIIAAIISFSIYNRPEAKMNRAIAAYNLSEAYEIYRNDLVGITLSDKTLSIIKKTADSVVSDYENGRMSYEDAEKILDDLSTFIFNTDAPSDLISESEEKLLSLYNYNSYMESADEYYSEENYLEAMQFYRYALDLNAESEEAAEGVSKSEEAYRNDIISQADTYISNREYDSAEKILNTGLSNLENDATLKEKLNGLNDTRVKNIVDDAYSYTEGGDWDSAVELLEEAQSQYSSNQSIVDAYNDIREKMPITLKNIITISSHSFLYETIKEVVKDRYGNIYDGAVKFSACSGNDNEVYALYNLEKKYKKFIATAFVGKDSDAVEECSISIYLDDELVLYKDDITVDTAPINIDLDVTGKSTLRIKVDNRWLTGAQIYFGNSSFEKVEE